MFQTEKVVILEDLAAKFQLKTQVGSLVPRYFQKLVNVIWHTVDKPLTEGFDEAVASTSSTRERCGGFGHTPITLPETARSCLLL